MINASTQSIAQTFTDIIKTTKLEPRPYQERTVNKIINLYAGTYVDPLRGPKPRAKSVFLEAPCGAGKTSMALMVAKIMQRYLPGLVVGWIAMRRNLLVQAAAENESKGINVQDFYPTSMFTNDLSKLIAARQAGRPILIVCDESHHDSVDSMVDIYRQVQPDFMLGPSATPYRTDSVKLCFDAIVKDAGIHRLIQDGYLSQYDHHTIEDWKPETVAKHYLSDPQRWGKSVFYFKNLDLCQRLQTQFEQAGVRSTVVDGSSDRMKQLDAFRAGELDCVINCMVLTEGFDFAPLQTAWVRDSSKTPTIQMGGRAFRKFVGPDGIMAVKKIVQSNGTKWPFLRTAGCREQWAFKDGEWLSLKINPKIQQVQDAAQRLIASTVTTMPDFITKHAIKARHRRRRRATRMGSAG